MRLKKLNIDSFRHLENLKFDFIYPEDFHIKEKRGKPLDKICIIGQSATGKTGILELIKSRFEDITEYTFFEKINFKNIYSDHKDYIEFQLIDDYKDIYSIELENNILNLIYNENNKEKGLEILKKISLDTLISIESNIVNDKNTDFFNKDSFDIISRFQNIELNHGFSYTINENIWFEILEDVIDYRKKQLDLSSKLTSGGQIFDSTISEIINEFNSENPNPLVNYSDKFNSILKKINLEFDSTNTNKIISFKHLLTKENIDISKASTGTKQLLFTYLPLLKLNTKGSIILIDEPERSLYPDIQMELMNFYQKIAPDAQFIIATHSPFVAAAFEPCERFILYFNEEGKVTVRGGISPIGDDPNDILKQDFGLEFLMNAQGLKAFEKFKNLKKELSEEDDESKKAILLNEILTLANAYKF
jgi:predicted ATP-dependent endonuclease of OLD family